MRPYIGDFAERPLRIRIILALSLLFWVKVLKAALYCRRLDLSVLYLRLAKSRYHASNADNENYRQD
jgi:hypothetical protein